jgi:hypothetical protein
MCCLCGGRGCLPSVAGVSLVWSPSLQPSPWSHGVIRRRVRAWLLARVALSGCTHRIGAAVGWRCRQQRHECAAAGASEVCRVGLGRGAALRICARAADAKVRLPLLRGEAGMDQSSSPASRAPIRPDVEEHLRQDPAGSEVCTNKTVAEIKLALQRKEASDYHPRFAKPEVDPCSMGGCVLSGSIPRNSGRSRRKNRPRCRALPPFLVGRTPCDTDGSNEAKPAENCFCYKGIWARDRCEGSIATANDPNNMLNLQIFDPIYRGL